MNREELKLGFDKIRDMAESLCVTNLAREMVREIHFSSDRDKIRQELLLADEMKSIQMVGVSFPDTGYVDIVPFLKRLEPQNSCISVDSIKKLSQAIETIRKIISFLKNNSEKYPNLSRLAGEVVIFGDINRRIDSLLDKFGEIKDNATPELNSIRSEIRSKQNLISSKIRTILKKAKSDGLVEEDAEISIRDGRSLIPVLATNKRKLSGYVYDESASGKTAFIEPLEIIEINNKVRELLFAEQREILRILADFSDFLRPYLPEIIHSGEFLSLIDFVRAKALLAIRMNAGMPIISEERQITLHRARHPILEAALKKENKEIVPLTLSLTKNRHILLISGPNAGGKSVCLKTVGLIQYMFQSGFLVPAAEISELAIFEKIFIDIGDEQSIENDLSTYSSHLSNMREILRNATESSLILIDEFGAGTEPVAGGAIAESILTELDKRACFGVITTHYSNLKFYANSSRGVINGGMQFDVKNIQPLFQLEIGVPGSSFAFELAKKMGLPDEIIKYAEEKAGEDFIDLEMHLKKIARNRREIEGRLARIKTTDKVLENITTKYEKELSDIHSTRKRLLQEAKEEANAIIVEANKKIESAIREIRENQAEREKTKNIRKELQEFSNSLEKRALPDQDKDLILQKMEKLKRRKERQQQRKQDGKQSVKQTDKTDTSQQDSIIRIGDKVKVFESDLIGEVIRVNNREASIAIGSIVSTMSLAKIKKISNNEYLSKIKKPTISTTIGDQALSERRLNFKPYIDIRGERLDSALEKVQHFVDDALMLGMSEVKILHGKGNGILREEIRKYLKITGGVLSFRDEVLEAGGAGITVVSLA